MILIAAGADGQLGFEAALIFAGQISERGHAVVIDKNWLPDQLASVEKYDASKFSANISDIVVSHVLVIGADRLSEAILTRFRNYNFDSTVQVCLIGRFEDSQQKFLARSIVANALGINPTVFDLTGVQSTPLLEKSIAPLFTFGDHSEKKLLTRKIIMFVLPPDEAEPNGYQTLFSSFETLTEYQFIILHAGEISSHRSFRDFAFRPIFSASEFLPNTFSGMAEIVIFVGEICEDERLAAIALGAMSQGSVVVDASHTGWIAGSGAPAIRGPYDPNELTKFLTSKILVNQNTLVDEIVNDLWLQENSFDRLEEALCLKTPSKPKRIGRRKCRTVFAPTNGVGLGHAKRCSLIADALGQDSIPVFAAFPSCLPLLQSCGFDCLPLVSKSADHVDKYAHDLLNYQRIAQYIRQGDKLVFDGGNIVDSVYRTIIERKISAVWIRRGLWQTGQSALTPIERGHAFVRTVIPREAFEELNTDTIEDCNTFEVGPIVDVQPLSKKKNSSIRTRLKKHFKLNFDKLVVTMLGAGTAADQTAHIQSICNQIGNHPSCLHLVVVWPNATVSPTLFGWSNSFVVRTNKAMDLCQASDFVISAAGYNSFNELLYHNVPTIFVPQMAGFMDDQERRARAASDRGLGVIVLANEMVRLRSEVAAFLNEGKTEELNKNLRNIKLPEIGTMLAASLIEEVDGFGE